MRDQFKAQEKGQAKAQEKYPEPDKKTDRNDVREVIAAYKFSLGADIYDFINTQLRHAEETPVQPFYKDLHIAQLHNALEELGDAVYGLQEPLNKDDAVNVAIFASQCHMMRVDLAEAVDRFMAVDPDYKDEAGRKRVQQYDEILADDKKILKEALHDLGADNVVIEDAIMDAFTGMIEEKRELLQVQRNAYAENVAHNEQAARSVDLAHDPKYQELMNMEGDVIGLLVEVMEPEDLPGFIEDIQNMDWQHDREDFQQTLLAEACAWKLTHERDRDHDASPPGVS